MKNAAFKVFMAYAMLVQFTLTPEISLAKKANKLFAPKMKSTSEAIKEAFEIVENSKNFEQLIDKINVPIEQKEKNKAWLKQMGNINFPTVTFNKKKEMIYIKTSAGRSEFVLLNLNPLIIRIDNHVIVYNGSGELSDLYEAISKKIDVENIKPHKSNKSAFLWKLLLPNSNAAEDLAAPFKDQKKEDKQKKILKIMGAVVLASVIGGLGWMWWQNHKEEKYKRDINNIRKYPENAGDSLALQARDDEEIHDIKCQNESDFSFVNENNLLIELDYGNKYSQDPKRVSVIDNVTKEECFKNTSVAFLKNSDTAKYCRGEKYKDWDDIQKEFDAIFMKKILRCCSIAKCKEQLERSSSDSGDADKEIPQVDGSSPESVGQGQAQ